MTTVDGLRALAAGAACAVLLSLSGCGGGTQSAQCTVDQDALAERIADRVYERLREQGHLDGDAGAAARAPSPGGERAEAAEDGGDSAITPRNIVNALRRGLQGTPPQSEEPR